MGIKRKGIGVNKSDDKKARFAAGLDLEHHQLDESMLDQIIKEVSAPKPVKQQIDQFITDFVKAVKKCKLSKALSPEEESEVGKLSSNVGSFSGAKIIDCVPVGSLRSNSLVFPNAVGELQVKVKSNQALGDAGAVVVQLLHALENCPLLRKDSVKYVKQLFGNKVGLEVVPAAKFGKHFKLQIHVVDDTDDVLDQGDSLVLLQPYHSAAVGLEVWRRQCCLSLPSQLFPVLLLHLQTLGLVNINMKSWQIVKKLWSFLSTKHLTETQMILGVSEAVDVGDHKTAALLDREGQHPVFPGLTLTQWNALVRYFDRK